MDRQVNKISLGVKKQQLSELEKTNARLARAQRQCAYWQTLERKHDTRIKLQLGNLIKSSGLDQEDPAIILGLLLEGAGALNTKSAETARLRWRLAGNNFLEKETSTLPSKQEDKKNDEH